MTKITFCYFTAFEPNYIGLVWLTLSASEKRADPMKTHWWYVTQCMNNIVQWNPAVSAGHAWHCHMDGTTRAFPAGRELWPCRHIAGVHQGLEQWLRGAGAPRLVGTQRWPLGTAAPCFSSKPLSCLSSLVVWTLFASSQPGDFPSVKEPGSPEICKY